MSYSKPGATCTTIPTTTSTTNTVTTTMRPQQQPNPGGATDAGMGNTLNIGTSATNLGAGDYCWLQPNTDYYLNITCGRAVGDAYNPSNQEPPWIPGMNCPLGDPSCSCPILSQQTN